MNTPEKIRDLAWERIEEAKILCDCGKINGAYYIAGYSVELMLKAAMCCRIGAPNLFDEEDQKVNAIDGIGDVRRAVKTHNLNTLLFFSGLRTEFNSFLKNQPKPQAVFSSFLENWSESCRYKPIGYIAKQDVEDLIYLLNNEQGILKWIEKHM